MANTLENSYRTYAQLLTPKGFPKELEDPRLFQWIQAQIPSMKHLFLAKATTQNKSLWGLVNTLGEGDFQIPIAPSGTEFQFPALFWMIDKNRKTLNTPRSYHEMFVSVGLEFNQQYGGIRLSTSSGSLRGINHSMDLYLDPAPEMRNVSWRNTITILTTEQLHASSVICAMEVADTIKGNVPGMVIEPVPQSVLFSPAAV